MVDFSCTDVLSKTVPYQKNKDQIHPSVGILRIIQVKSL